MRRQDIEGTDQRLGPARSYRAGPRRIVHGHRPAQVPHQNYQAGRVRTGVQLRNAAEALRKRLVVDHAAVAEPELRAAVSRRQVLDIQARPIESRKLQKHRRKRQWM